MELKKLIFFIFVSLYLLGTTKELKINYAPEYKGLELTEKLEKNLSLSFSNIGYKINFTNLPNLRGLEEANNGNIDGEFPRGKFIIDSYKSLFYIDVTLFSENFFAYSLDKKYNTWKDIEGKKIGIHFGSKISEINLSQNTKKTQVFYLKDRKALYQMLESKRIELLFLSEKLGDKIIEENNASFILKGEKPLYEDNFYLLLNKKHLNLKPLIEKELVKNSKLQF